jgi:hypothetical protein
METLSATKFSQLFAGRTDALGFGEGRVEKRPVTLRDYISHLEGDGNGIGIFPMRDDNTVLFSAIDLDEPNFALATTLRTLIPGESYVERSRSGNAHVWVFFSRACPAWAARGVLRGALDAVGRTEVEVFPKQDRLREDMVGNYINLPYHGTDRPVLWDDGSDMPQEEFIKLAGNGLQDPDAWERRARRLGYEPPEEREATAEWGTSPKLHMCAEHIIAHREDNPVTSGHRHQVLFHLACQLLNYSEFSQGEAWHYVQQVNAAGAPPLPANELQRMFDNAVDGRFTFTGCDDPVMQPYVHPDCPIAGGKAGR